MAGDDAIKNHAAERRLFILRTVAAAIFLVVLVGLLFARMFYLQVSQFGYYQIRSKDNITRVDVVPPVRGLIYDRSDQLLANNLPAYALEIVPDQVKGSVKKTIARLSKIIDITDADRKQFFSRLNQTPPFRGTPIKLSLTQAEVAHFEVDHEQFPGVDIRAGLTRNYPLGIYGSHVIGYVGGITAADLAHVDAKLYRGSSYIGKSGVELYYEAKLHGTPGSRVVETNAAGRALRQISESPARAGDNLYLTLDSKLQKFAYNALGKNNGAVVALDPKTGGVLAIVSKPGFDPDLFVNGISDASYKKLLHNPNNPLYDRALEGQYPPGSTVKPMMAIGALQTGVIDPYQKIFCPGYITLPGSSHRYHDWKRSGQGWINLTQAIERSSDVYFYKLGLKLGIENLDKYARMFGLGHKTGIDLPREDSGIVPSPAWKRAHRGKPWYPGDTIITTIGQGFMTATPLQLAVMVSEFAERGHAFRPHVLRAFENPRTGKMHPYKPEPLPPIVVKNPNEWNIVINAMHGVIANPYGTAHNFIGRNPEYQIAGKTGSAQVTNIPQGELPPNPGDVPYKLRTHALFVAFAPMDDPKIAVAIFVEHGGGGPNVAAPIARQVIDFYLNSLKADASSQVAKSQANTTSPGSRRAS